MNNQMCHRDETNEHCALNNQSLKEKKKDFSSSCFDGYLYNEKWKS